MEKVDSTNSNPKEQNSPGQGIAAMFQTFKHMFRGMYKFDYPFTEDAKMDIGEVILLLQFILSSPISRRRTILFLKAFSKISGTSKSY